jgi:hypothetical protein
MSSPPDIPSMWPAKIDEAVQRRDFEWLTRMVTVNLPHVDREYLAKVILDLLTGKIRPPARRPKNPRTEWRDRDLAYRAVTLQQRPEWGKRTAVVEKLHEETGCAKSTIWKAIAEHGGMWEYRMEEAAYDAMLDLAYEAEWESAVDALRGEHGEREFTDEEIRDQIEKDREAYADFDP